MSMNSYKELVDKYKDYLKSSEALAVYLVKSYVRQVDTRNKWIDIVNSSTWEHRSGKTAFNYIIIEVFDRMKHPIYPKRTDQMDDYGYRQICKAITWEVSHDDIRDQRERGIRGQLFLTIVPIYNKNKGKKVVIEKPFWNEEYGGYDYTGNVPTTTKKIEKDMEPDWDYFVKACKQITDVDVDRITKYFDSYILPRIHQERNNRIKWYFVDYGSNKKQSRKINSLKEKNELKHREGLLQKD